MEPIFFGLHWSKMGFVLLLRVELRAKAKKALVGAADIQSITGQFALTRSLISSITSHQRR